MKTVGRKAIGGYGLLGASIVLVLSLSILALPSEFTGLTLFQPVISGEMDIMKNYTSSGSPYEVPLKIDGAITSLKVTGNVYGDGRVKVVLMSGKKKRTVLKIDTEKEFEYGLPITGMVTGNTTAAEDSAEDAPAEEESQNETVEEHTAEETIEEVTEEIPEDNVSADISDDSGAVENVTVPEENVTVPEINETASEEPNVNVTVPEENVTAPEENVTVPEEEPVENVTIPEENVTVPEYNESENMRLSEENLTETIENVTIPEENVTIPDNVTDVLENVTETEENATDLTEPETEENVTVPEEHPVENATLPEENVTAPEINETVTEIVMTPSVTSFYDECDATCLMSPLEDSILAVYVEGDAIFELVSVKYETESEITATKLTEKYQIIRLFEDMDLTGNFLLSEVSAIKELTVTPTEYGYVMDMDFGSDTFTVDSLSIKKIKPGLIKSMLDGRSKRVIVKTNNQADLVSIDEPDMKTRDANVKRTSSEIFSKKFDVSAGNFESGDTFLDVVGNEPLVVKRATEEYVSVEPTFDYLEDLLSSDFTEEIVPDKTFITVVNESLIITRTADSHTLGYSGQGTSICVVDDGINLSVLGLVDGVNVFGYNFVDDNEDYGNTHSHGTIVTYVMKSMAPNATIYVAKVIGGLGYAYSSDIIAALDWCEDSGVDIVSISLSEGAYEGYCDDGLVPGRVNEISASGIVVVASAGNSGFSSAISSPACSSSAIRVTASTKSDTIWSRSSYNNATLIVAPGSDVYVMDSEGRDTDARGTSISAALVSGITSLLVENDSTMTTNETKYRLVRTGDLILYSGRQFSRVNAYNALTENYTNNLTEGAVGNGSNGTWIFELTTLDEPCLHGNDCDSGEVCVWGSCRSDCDHDAARDVEYASGYCCSVYGSSTQCTSSAAGTCYDSTPITGGGAYGCATSGILRMNCGTTCNLGTNATYTSCTTNSGDACDHDVGGNFGQTGTCASGASNSCDTSGEVAYYSGTYYTACSHASVLAGGTCDSSVTGGDYSANGMCTETDSGGSINLCCDGSGKDMVGETYADTGPYDHCPAEDSSSPSECYTCDTDASNGMNGAGSADAGVWVPSSCCTANYAVGSSGSDQTPCNYCTSTCSGSTYEGKTCRTNADYDNWAGIIRSTVGICVDENACELADVCTDGSGNWYNTMTSCSEGDACDSDVSSGTTWGYSRDGYKCDEGNNFGGYWPARCVVDGSATKGTPCCTESGNANCDTGLECGDGPGSSDGCRPTSCSPGTYSNPQDGDSPDNWIGTMSLGDLYARGYCALMQGCDGLRTSSTSTRTATSSEQVCRCDAYWGCVGHSCFTTGSREYFNSVTCEECDDGADCGSTDCVDRGGSTYGDCVDCASSYDGYKCSDAGSGDDYDSSAGGVCARDTGSGWDCDENEVAYDGADYWQDCYYPDSTFPPLSVYTCDSDISNGFSVDGMCASMADPVDYNTSTVNCYDTDISFASANFYIVCGNTASGNHPGDGFRCDTDTSSGVFSQNGMCVSSSDDGGSYDCATTGHACRDVQGVTYYENSCANCDNGDLADQSGDWSGGHDFTQDARCANGAVCTDDYDEGASDYCGCDDASDYTATGSAPSTRCDTNPTTGGENYDGLCVSDGTTCDTGEICLDSSGAPTHVLRNDCTQCSEVSSCMTDAQNNGQEWNPNGICCSGSCVSGSPYPTSNCCTDTDCPSGYYCDNYACTVCTASDCASHANCRDGTAGCCDAHSDCTLSGDDFCFTNSAVDESATNSPSDDSDTQAGNVQLASQYVCSPAKYLDRGTEASNTDSMCHNTKYGRTQTYQPGNTCPHSDSDWWGFTYGADDGPVTAQTDYLTTDTDLCFVWNYDPCTGSDGAINYRNGAGTRGSLGTQDQGYSITSGCSSNWVWINFGSGTYGNTVGKNVLGASNGKMQVMMEISTNDFVREWQFGWRTDEDGETDASNSYWCCDDSTDCVDDAPSQGNRVSGDPDSTASGCYNTASTHDTGGGHGTDLEYCDSGTWRAADSTSTVCSIVGGTWSSTGTGTYSDCCGDDGASDDFNWGTNGQGCCCDGVQQATENLICTGYSNRWCIDGTYCTGGSPAGTVRDDSATATGTQYTLSGDDTFCGCGGGGGTTGDKCDNIADSDAVADGLCASSTCDSDLVSTNGAGAYYSTCATAGHGCDSNVMSTGNAIFVREGYCLSGSCVLDSSLSLGESCSHDGQCSGSLVCCSGKSTQCDGSSGSTSGTCSYPDGNACTTGTSCCSGVCNEGTCLSSIGANQCASSTCGDDCSANSDSYTDYNQQMWGPVNDGCSSSMPLTAYTASFGTCTSVGSGDNRDSDCQANCDSGLTHIETRPVGYPYQYGRCITLRTYGQTCCQPRGIGGLGGSGGGDCAANLNCTGAGAAGGTCLYNDGQTCTDGDDCYSDVCVNGYCRSSCDQYAGYGCSTTGTSYTTSGTCYDDTPGAAGGAYGCDEAGVLRVDCGTSCDSVPFSTDPSYTSCTTNSGDSCDSAVGGNFAQDGTCASGATNNCDTSGLVAYSGGTYYATCQADLNACDSSVTGGDYAQDGICCSSSCVGAASSDCCDDTDCLSSEVCDESADSANIYACESCISLSRGTWDNTQRSSGTFGDICFTTSFSATADACVMYSLYDTEAETTDTEIRVNQAFHSWTTATGDNLWDAYVYNDLSGSVSTGTNYIEFDDHQRVWYVDEVLFGWTVSEAGETDGTGSTSCCDASTDCVDDYAMGDNVGSSTTGTQGCYNTGTGNHDTGGGDGTDYEYCNSGTWVAADADQTACEATPSGVWLGSSSGTYTKCCGDGDGSGEDFSSGANGVGCCCDESQIGENAPCPGYSNRWCIDGTYCGTATARDPDLTAGGTTYVSNQDDDEACNCDSSGVKCTTGGTTTMSGLCADTACVENDADVCYDGSSYHTTLSSCSNMDTCDTDVTPTPTTPRFVQDGIICSSACVGSASSDCCADTDCPSGQYCSAGYVCTVCTINDCLDHPNCRDGTGGCCDADSDCNSSSICVGDDLTSNSPCSFNWTCRESDDTISIGDMDNNGYAASTVWGWVDECGDRGYDIPASAECVRYSVFDDDSNANTLMVNYNKDDDTNWTHSPYTGGDTWRFNYIIDHPDVAGNIMQWEVREQDTGFSNISFGYYIDELGDSSGSGDYGCCDESNDCVYDSLQGDTTQQYGCYDDDTATDVGGGDGADSEYCDGDGVIGAANTWVAADASSTACSGVGDSWRTGGEAEGFGGYSTGSETECCGDDSSEYAIDEQSYTTGDYDMVWDNNEIHCCNESDRCNAGGTCYTGSTSPGVDTEFTGLNPGANDDMAYCYNSVGNGRWLDCDRTDYMDYWCGSCGPGRGSISPRSPTYTANASWNAAASGEGSDHGEYNSTDRSGGVLECCGDDADEIYGTCTVDSTLPDSGGQTCDTSADTHDDACCNLATDCVTFGSSLSCAASGSHTTDADDSGDDDYCDAGTWRDCFDTGDCDPTGENPEGDTSSYGADNVCYDGSMCTEACTSNDCVYEINNGWTDCDGETACVSGNCMQETEYGTTNASGACDTTSGAICSTPGDGWDVCIPSDGCPLDSDWDGVMSDCHDVEGGNCYASSGDTDKDLDNDGDNDWCSSGTWYDCETSAQCDTGSGYHCNSTNDCTDVAPYGYVWEIHNSGGSPVAVVDEDGDMFIDGSLYESQGSLSPPQGSLIIQNSAGSTVAYISSSGDLYLLGTLTENDVSGMAGYNLEVHDPSDTVVVWFDDEGNAQLNGNIIQGYTG